MHVWKLQCYKDKKKTFTGKGDRSTWERSVAGERRFYVEKELTGFRALTEEGLKPDWCREKQYHSDKDGI